MRTAGERAATLGRESADSYFRLGNVYLSGGETEKAVAELKRTVEIAPDWAEPYRMLTDLYSKDETGNAVAELRRVTELAPQWAVPYLLGSFYSSREETDKAIAEFRRAAEFAPAGELPVNSSHQADATPGHLLG